jgi:hypothetical protein
MNHHQSINRVLPLRSWGPKRIARLRVAIGIWLLLLTAILYASGVGGLWELSLVGVAALHFVLAASSFRIARNDRDRGTRFQ